VVADNHNNNNARSCYTHFMEYRAVYASEGEARWDAELMYADWKNHWPDYRVALTIFEENGEWGFLLTAKKEGCNLAEH